MKQRIAFAALVTCLSIGLAACGVSALQPGATSASPHAAGSSPASQAGCPRGRLLPAGTEEAIDYVDFVQVDGRSYDGGLRSVSARQLGPVITYVRCSLIAEEDQHYGAPPIIDRTASFLPAGAPVYEIHGYPPACRLAAYLHGRLHAYLAHGQTSSAPVPCAVRRPWAKSAPSR